MTPTADCEVRDDWFLAQDVNAWTSLAYAAVGVLIVGAVVRWRVAPAFAALGGLLVLEGIGSLLFHGGGGDVAQLLHDGPLVGVLGFVAGWQVGRLLGRAGAAAIVGLVAGAAAGVIGSASGGTNGAVAAFAVVIAGAEIVARTCRLPAVWTVPLLALGLVAVATWLAGTSGSALCVARSWAQPHGLWHVLSAVVVLAWFDAATTAAEPERAPRLFRRLMAALSGRR